MKENKEVLTLLNKLLEQEYAGVIRYSHYSFMVFGFNRIPIVSWLREQSQESLTHAERIGEQITSLGGHPSFNIAVISESHKHSIKDILDESLAHEKSQIKLFYDLLTLVEGQNVVLEEFARSFVVEEETHVSEVEKMLRNTK